MPYTTVVAGTTITATWGNANVRDQGVTPHATASARDSAVTSPVEGMLHYLADGDAFWFHNGALWKPLGEHLIGSSTLASPASQVLFSAIPNNYSHIRIVIAGKSSSPVNGDNVLMQFNGDTGANYTRAAWDTSNTTGGGSGNVTYSETTGQTSALGPDLPGTNLTDSRQCGHVLVDIPAYNDSVYGKHIFTRGAAVIGANAWSVTQRQSGWFVATAVSSVRLFLGSGGNFQTNSRFSLYGVAG